MVDAAPEPLDDGAEDVRAMAAASVDTAGSQISWDEIRAEVQTCKQCGLCETRKRTVFGSGPRSARWMLIGEAPGAEEDARGEPFVGQAGRLLDPMLASIGLSRDADVFITNVLKCRPPGNRNPEPLEAETCSRYLYQQIEMLQPDLIVLLGRFAMQSVLKTDANVASLRQRVHHYPGLRRRIPVICTYHPAYLLRNLPEKRKSWEDLCLALDVARQEQERRRETTGD
jgi:DNA polymerase